MKKEIPFYKPTIDENELEQIKSVLSLESKSKTEELENEIKEFIGANHVISTYNSTAGLHLALSAMDLKRADKVLMSVNSFPNLPEVVRHFDAEPIFIDIESNGLNIDMDKLEEYVSKNNSKKLRAIIVTFVGGEIPDLERLYAIRKKYNILIIEDALNTLGAMYKDELVGNLKADMTVFSMNPVNGKSSVANAGFIVTNSDELANRARLLRTHAINSSFDAFGNLDYIYDVVDIGHKYDMTDLDAAFNLAQFYKSNAFIERRQEIAKLYIENLQDVKHVAVPTFNEDHLFTQFIVKISKNRDGFARELKKEGISTGLTYIPLHLLTYYKQKYGLKITAYGNALSAYGQILSLPMYPSLSDEEVLYICDKIKQISKSWI
ncbi:MAG: DegT/DnrJ/EryC1/StrS aminotransferase family protein [Arcobacteraceae bacterium]|nr:DegT/DnrJ/EryC1/StrS aminotransferase family protein [Arcobacteraceae bacterium]